MDEKELLEETEEKAIEAPSENEGGEAVKVDEIPIELRGLSPEMQQEAMKELDINQPKEEQEQEEADIADTDSVKKEAEPAFKKPAQKIPYERFKEMVDKNNEMKAELEALKTKLAELPKQQPTPQATTQQTAPRQTFNVTPDMAQQIDTVINQQAVAMAGLSKDDLDSLEYMDDDDPRKVRYNHAKEMAKAEVYYNIQQARVQQQQQYQQAVAYHNQVVNNYNEFFVRETAEPDYEAVKDYAMGAFFEEIDAGDQRIIKDAYERIDRNIANPQDIALIKRFYLDAKNSYRQKNASAQAAQKAKGAANNIESKYQQQKAFPRASQVNGSAANVGTPPSADALERMLNELPWDEIPDEYKQLVMNSSTLMG